MILTKQQLLDYLSDIIDREKASLENTQTYEISKEAEEFRNSRSTKKLFAFFEEKGYHIISLTEKQSIPRDRSQLASLLTKNRKILFPFINVLLHCKGGAFSVQDFSLESLNSLLNICKNFSNRKWIDYKYDKKENYKDNWFISDTITSNAYARLSRPTGLLAYSDGNIKWTEVRDAELYRFSLPKLCHNGNKRKW